MMKGLKQTLFTSTQNRLQKRSQNTRLNANNKKHHHCVPHEKNKDFISNVICTFLLEHFLSGLYEGELLLQKHRMMTYLHCVMCCIRTCSEDHVQAPWNNRKATLLGWVSTNNKHVLCSSHTVVYIFHKR